jgi:glycosyltransferase involved in cell wall biosynthesis
MKIAMTGNVFPFGEGVAYGGERILYYLTAELTKLGHEVHVFAREGCQLPPEVCASYTPVGPMRDGVDVHLDAVVRSGIDFDIYQCNYFGNGFFEDIWNRGWGYCELTWCVWCHAGFQFPKVSPFNVISCSKNMQEDFIRVGKPVTMIHFGIPKNLYRFEPDHDGYAVWLGKIESGKAPDLAIKIALAAGLKIVIIGPPYNTGHFWELVAPYIDNERVFWARGADDSQKQVIMSRAKVFIMSNCDTWREHFGIVSIEALAMGVPVIGFTRIGDPSAISTEPIIEDGKQGFFLEYETSNKPDEIIEKGAELCGKIDQIDRAECRSRFENNFTSRLMARRYEWLYNQIKDGARQPTWEIPF